MEEKPSFYAIVPATVRYDNNLIPNAKMLYGEITALCNQNGYCWASNEYFSKLYGVSKQSISTWITSLEKNGHIEREIIYKQGSKEIERRLIRIVTTPHQENLNTPHQENLKENSTSLNNVFLKDKIHIRHLNPSDVEKQKQTSSKSKCSEEEAKFFEEIWLLYPRKNGKADVSDKHKKVLYKLGYDVVKKCIDRYLAENKNPEFYKYGSTFFKSGYIDYLDENYSQRSSNGETEQRAVGQPLELNNMKQKERFQQ